MVHPTEGPVCSNSRRKLFPFLLSWFCRMILMCPILWSHTWRIHLYQCLSCSIHSSALGLHACVFFSAVWLRLELVTSWMIPADTVGLLPRTLSLLLLWWQRKQVCTKHFEKQNVTVKTNKWYFNNPIPSLPSKCKCPFQSGVNVCTITPRAKYFSLWTASIWATIRGWGCNGAGVSCRGSCKHVHRF